MQAAGGPAKVQLLRYGQEAFEMAHLHVIPLQNYSLPEKVFLV